MIIAVEGVFGVGKSALVAELAKRHGLRAVLEPVTDSPLLAAYYRDPKAYALTFQLFVLMQRVAQHIDASHDLRTHHLFDRSIIGDLIFATMHIAEGNMSTVEAALYLDTFRRVTEALKPPDVVVWLDAPSEMVLDRIHGRGREAEKNISLDYLEKNRRAHAQSFEGNSFNWDGTPVRVVKLLWSAFTSAEDVLTAIQANGIDLWGSAADAR